MSMEPDYYSEFLEVPPGARPPDLYTLLGVPPFCADQARIQAAARAQIKRLGVYENDPDPKRAAASHAILAEVKKAAALLVNPGKRSYYDRQLANHTGEQEPKVQESSPDTGSVTTRKTARRRQPSVKEQAEIRPGLAQSAGRARNDTFASVVSARLSQDVLGEHEVAQLLAKAPAYGLSQEEARRVIEKAAIGVGQVGKHGLHVAAWGVGLGITVVSIGVVFILWANFLELRHDREVSRLAAEVRRLIEIQSWDKTREVLDELCAIDEPACSNVAAELDRGRIQSHLDEAAIALRERAWSICRRELDSARELSPQGSQLRDLGEAENKLVNEVTAVVREDLSLAKQHTDAKEWDKAYGKIDDARKVLKQAKISAGQLYNDCDAEEKSVTAARERDWGRLVHDWEAARESLCVDLMESIVAEAEEHHPDRRPDIDQWSQILKDIRETTRKVTASIDKMLAERKFKEALQIVHDSPYMPAKERELLKDKIEAVWVKDARIIWRHAGEAIRQSKRAYANAAIANVFLSNTHLEALHADLKTMLDETVAHIGPEDEFPLARFELKNGSIVEGVIVGTDLVTVLVRELLRDDPLVYDARVRKIMKRDIVSQRTVRVLSGEEKRDTLLNWLDTAIEDGDHLVILDYAGRLRVWHFEGNESEILGPRRLTKVEDAVRAVAALCPNCVGSGVIPCPRCDGTGRVDGMIPCPFPRCEHGQHKCIKCGGAGNTKCPKCHGRGTIRLFRLVGRKKEYYIEKCPKCHGRGRIDCPKCDHAGQLFTCEKCGGKGQIPGKVPCPACDNGSHRNRGSGRIRCPMCAGTGRRPDVRNTGRGG